MGIVGTVESLSSQEHGRIPTTPAANNAQQEISGMNLAGLSGKPLGG